MSDKDMVTVYERRDGSKPGLWSVYWYLGWDVFYSFSLEPSDLEHHRLSGAYQL